MYTLFFINILAILLAYLSGKTKNTSYLLAAFLFIGIVLGLRYNYGNDYFNYYEIYKDCNTSKWNGDIDLGWYVINRIFHPIGYMGMILIITVTQQLLIYRVIKNNITPKWFWFAVFIYCFTSNYMALSCSMIRQSLVMAIMLNSVPLIERRQFVKYLILVAISFSIHKIALLTLPLFLFTYTSRIIRSRSFIFIIFACVLFVIGNVEYLFELGFKLIADSGTDYVNYFFWDEGVIGKRQVIIYVLFLLLFLRNKNRLSNIQLIFALIVVIAYLLLPVTTMVQIFLRVILLFAFFQIINYPQLIYNERFIGLRSSILIVYIVSTLLDFYRFFYSETYGLFYKYYHSIFSANNFI